MVLLQTLRLVFKATNWVLLIVGIAMVLHAAWLLVEFERKLPGPSPPPPPPEGEGDDIEADDSGGWDASPWFVYAFGAAGMHVAMTAGAGLLGTACESKCCLVCHNLLLVALLVVQTAVVVGVFSSRATGEGLPPDVTGNEERAWRFVQANVPVIKYGGLALLCAEVANLAIGQALQACRTHHLRDDEDPDAYFERHYAEPRRPGHLARTARSSRASPSPGPDDAWSQHMRDKYGLDVSHMAYHPGSHSHPYTRSPDPPEQAPGSRFSRCSLM